MAQDDPYELLLARNLIRPGDLEIFLSLDKSLMREFIRRLGTRVCVFSCGDLYLLFTAPSSFIFVSSPTEKG